MSQRLVARYLVWRIRTLRHADDTAKPFRAVAWNEDGTALAVGRQDGIIRIWHLAP